MPTYHNIQSAAKLAGVSAGGVRAAIARGELAAEVLVLGTGRKTSIVTDEDVRRWEPKTVGRPAKGGA